MYGKKHHELLFSPIYMGLRDDKVCIWFPLIKIMGSVYVQYNPICGKHTFENNIFPYPKPMEMLKYKE